ncbi:chemotaxis protein CheW [Magnetococcales bacterium HHB-1]
MSNLPIDTADKDPEESTPTLIFRLEQKLYGVNAGEVLEIVRIPEITPMEESPPFIAGVLNLRGRVAPVIDLALRMGRLPAPYQISDAIVILETKAGLVGVIINEIREVRPINIQEIDQAPSFGEEMPRRWRQCIQAVARIDDEMVMLLRPERLLSINEEGWRPAPGENPDENEVDSPTTEEPPTPPRIFFPNASDEERQLLKERSRRLSKAARKEKDQASTAIAVVTLHGEYLGAELKHVTGFAQVKQVTPIPCCPEHIVGDMNLRGDILTLVDITSLLNIPPSKNSLPEKTMLVQHEEITIGLMVDDVVDVIPIHANQLARAPSASGTIKQENLKGMIPYEESMVSLLNLKKLLTSDALTVNHSV